MPTRCSSSEMIPLRPYKDRTAKAMMNGGVIMGIVIRDNQIRDATILVRTNRKASGKATIREIRGAREPRMKVFFVTWNK